MSIINGLLTGGILIGKVCQALGAGPSSKTYTDTESGLAVTGEVTSGGVTFYRSNVNGQSIVYGYNKSTSSPAIITIPNETSADGVMYVIAPTEKVPVGEVDSPLVSPVVNVITGPTDAPPSSSPAPEGGGNSLLKLAFSNLNVGKTVNVGSFRISCNTAQLVIVSTQVTATALTYMYLRSNKGVAASNQNPIPPKSSTSTEDVEQHFDVDFAALGIDINNDLIEGQITLEVASTTSELAKLSKVPSEPLHPVEKEFFRLLSSGEL